MGWGEMLSSMCLSELALLAREHKQAISAGNAWHQKDERGGGEGGEQDNLMPVGMTPKADKQASMA